VTDFTLNIYLLIFLVFVLHFPLGKLFQLKSFFVSSLVGVSISACGVGFLANTNAGLIRWFLYFMLMANTTLMIRFALINRHLLKKFAFPEKTKTIRLLFMLTFFLFFFFTNNPQKTSYVQEGEKVFFNWNMHHTVHSSPTIEMLNAKYSHRIIFLDGYPKLHKPYHFFDSAALASIQTLIKNPNLVSYLIAQFFIVLFVLLSIIESVFLNSYKSLKSLFPILLFFILSVTIFYPVINLKFWTNGTFAIFAIYFFINSFNCKNERNFILFSLILGAVAIGQLPIALIVVCYSFFFQLTKAGVFKTIQDLKRNIRFVDIIGLVLFVAYNVATIFSVKLAQGQSQAFNGFLGSVPDLMDQGSRGYLFLWKMWAYVWQDIAPNLNVFKGTPSPIFNSFAVNNKTILIPFVFSIFSIFSFGYFLSIKKGLIYFVRINYFKILVSGLLVCMFLINVLYTNSAVWQINLVSLSYILLIYLILLRLRIYHHKSHSEHYYHIFALILATSYLIQFTGLAWAVRVTLTHITFECILLGLLGILITKEQTHIKKYVIISIISLSLFHVRIQDLLKIPMYQKIDITTLIQHKHERNRFVDKDNLLKDIPSNSSIANCYSLLLGAYLPNSTGTRIR
jgi:hypothetical protein